MKLRKSWRAKLADSKDLPRVEPITGKMSTRWGTGTVVIPAPMEVDELMRRVPKGKLTTVNEIKAALGKRHGASIGCPITTEIFALIGTQHPSVRMVEDSDDFWKDLERGKARCVIVNDGDDRKLFFSGYSFD